MDDILLGLDTAGARQTLTLSRANRHDLIAGATGTGKTVTLQVLAEQFSRAGVPVFVADVKGDLSGIAMAGTDNDKTAAPFQARARELGIDDYSWQGNPVVFWDLFGRDGHPVRATISEMGPLLLSRLMGLNDTQEGVLSIAFRYADDNGWLLLDMDDLRAVLGQCAADAAQLATKYGNVTKASVGAIQRQLLTFEDQGAKLFFGEPALEINDLLHVNKDGLGTINVLAADKLIQTPKLYATFLLWMLSELFETLPEVGDPDKPNLVFFFDEAHLLFDDVPKALIDKVEQVVRLIRSKGVGVYFVTQNPIDVPEKIIGQLGNRVQHALRAFTQRDQKAVQAAATTFRTNPALNVATVITELKVGEALVSTLDADGSPSVVQRTLIAPPRSRAGPLTEVERTTILTRSPFAGKYDTPVNRESAAEILEAKAQEAADAAKDVAEHGINSHRAKPKRQKSLWEKAGRAALGAAAASAGTQAARAMTGRKSSASPVASAISSAAGTIGTQVGGAPLGRFVRGLFGTLLR